MGAKTTVTRLFLRSCRSIFQIEQQRRLRAQVEKSRTVLDAEKTEVVNELTALQTAKAESEKKRKQADAVALELRARLAEYEASESDARQQLSKVIIYCE